MSFDLDRLLLFNFLKPKLNDYDTAETSPLAIRTIIKKPLGRGKLGGAGPKYYSNISNTCNLCKKQGFFVGGGYLFLL